MILTPQAAACGCLFAAACAVAVVVLIKQDLRRQDEFAARQKRRRAARAQREAACMPPPGHPDWETALDDGEVALFEGITSRMQLDEGLTILDRTEGDT